MTTSVNTTEYTVTSCPDHGEKVTSDFASFSAYVTVARDCQHGTDVQDDYEHDFYHVVMQHDCWVCCPEMVIDPFGLLDH